MKSVIPIEPRYQSLVGKCSKHSSWGFSPSLSTHTYTNTHTQAHTYHLLNVMPILRHSYACRHRSVEKYHEAVVTQFSVRMVNTWLSAVTDDLQLSFILILYRTSVLEVKKILYHECVALYTGQPQETRHSLHSNWRKRRKWNSYLHLIKHGMPSVYYTHWVQGGLESCSGSCSTSSCTLSMPVWRQ